MPSSSAKQHRAMMAAKYGRSKLGIQRRVGREFAAADAKRGMYQRMKRKKREQ